MKKFFLLIIILAILTACSQQTQVVRITGQVVVPFDTGIFIENIQDNPIYTPAQRYPVVPDSHGFFDMTIPLEHPAFAVLNYGNNHQKIFLEPGKHFRIKLSDDSLYFEGSNARENNFLIKMTHDEMDNRLLANHCLYNPKVTCQTMPAKLDSLFQMQKDYVDRGAKTYHLKRLFVKRLKVENRAARDYVLLNFPIYYAYRNGITPGTIELSDRYQKLISFKALTNDDNCISKSYIDNLSNKISYFASEQAATSGKTITADAINMIAYRTLLDSLNDNTRSYLLASWICQKLQNDQGFDSLAYREFKSTKQDKITQDAIDICLSFYNREQALLGQPLNNAFSNTILVGQNGKETTFGKIMAKHKNKVVYLDIWSTTCMPCRQAMPFSQTLKTRLKDKPVSFLYLSINDDTPNFWATAKALTGTGENHYVIKNKFYSQMLSFMQINGVPVYMIFDMNGCLVNYDAPRPSADINNDNSELINILTELAEK